MPGTMLSAGYKWPQGNDFVFLEPKDSRMTKGKAILKK